MKRTLSTAIIAASTTAAFAPTAQAESWLGSPVENSFQLRGRVLGVISTEESTVSPIGGEVEIDNAPTAEVDFTYFINSRFSIEAIAALSIHEVEVIDPYVSLGEVIVVPPTVTLQYRFLPDCPVQPYVGAGINYTFLKATDAPQQFDVSYDNSLGYALQIGADFMMSENWLFNLDLKYIGSSADASINGGDITADVDFNPVIIGAGIGFRF